MRNNVIYLGFQASSVPTEMCTQQIRGNYSLELWQESQEQTVKSSERTPSHIKLTVTQRSPESY